MRSALVLLILLTACVPQNLTVDTQLDLLEHACNVCDGTSSVDVLVRGILYTTENSVCIKRDNILSCASCGCALQPYETNLRSDTVCTFTPTDGVLVPSC